LCSPDDIRRLSQSILVYASAPPARLRLKRWDQVPDFRRKAEGGDRAPGSPRPSWLDPSTLLRRIRGKGGSW
jgi:hypothetical protein